ncbi:hypothetical protein RHOER0001_1203 [Rhodococcus erythropolis SK121]|nr:hypothetical protein RHOER0001_1203 [Rhodococcus erythropolis SK121]
MTSPVRSSAHRQQNSRENCVPVWRLGTFVITAGRRQFLLL